MIISRLIVFVIIFMAFAGLMVAWNQIVGFVWNDARWWQWLLNTIKATGGLPGKLLVPVYICAVGMILSIIMVFILSSRAGVRTTFGRRTAKDLHGSAQWASKKEIKKAGLLGKTGVVAGGFGKGKITALRHDGPEHICAFAPTRSGKGVGLVITTLLRWMDSALVLDIKGENYNFTAGWRESQGQKIFAFAPTALNGSDRFNVLTEVRFHTPNEIQDCQNIASMIIDPDGKGLKDFWMQSGWEWLSVVILHVLYRVKREEGRIASLSDCHAFMSATFDSESEGDEGFNELLDDMIAFDHKVDSANSFVRAGAGKMRIKASAERSGVHSSASVQLALYADPIVARNISESDFRLDDLMNGDQPATLYLIIPPADIDRLRPLTRVILNLFLRRLMASMEFEGGSQVKSYKHRLLLMLDEFTSVGKLEIFERALAFMAGYGIKAYIIIQDISQLLAAYGPKQSIMANCHLRIAYAPNDNETAQLLSRMAGETTIVQKKRSQSGQPGTLIGNVSDSYSETKRPLLTPDECARLRGPEKNAEGNITKAGDMLIFPSGSNPIYGRQYLFFKDKELLDRSKIPPPEKLKFEDKDMPDSEADRASEVECSSPVTKDYVALFSSTLSNSEEK